MRSVYILLLVLILLPVIISGVYANDKLIPKEGTIFVGENGIDLSDCNVRTGDEIAFWSSGSTDGIPDARAKIMDSSNFYVDPKIFSGKTGVWYGLVSKKPVFTVEDPWIQLEVVETGLDYNKEWIKRGSLVSFKISTNMFDVSKREGSAGVLVYLNMTGPNGTEYSTLVSPTGTFNLKKIFVYYSPYDTGAVWQTNDISKYPDGIYKVKAFADLNQIAEKNPGEGLASSLESTFLLNKTEPVKEKDKDKTVKEEKKASSSSKVKSKDSSITNEKNESSNKEVKKSQPKSTPAPKVTEVPVPTEVVTPVITFEDLEEQTYKFTPIPTKTQLPSPPKSKPTPTPKQQPINPITSMIAVCAGLGLLLIKRKA